VPADPRRATPGRHALAATGLFRESDRYCYVMGLSLQAPVS